MESDRVKGTFNGGSGWFRQPQNDRSCHISSDFNGSQTHNRPERVIIHIKSCKEKVVIGYRQKNLMLVEDGIDKTIITSARSVARGSSTVSSATLDVSGDEFWGRDITIENRAGPQDHQAVAMKAVAEPFNEGPSWPRLIL
ncbi:hypothetical protein QN277_001860 [Acacia crassicarpa]|uniref:Pectinesterase catalytic domain-containing protein n=1 Tax=Acacia crassicarpa TaxID=499986 RepID=A0AAE1N891_9FABA|nr:hypothetical protein QN277_001860 [Acacia crassicarpa]